MRSVRCRELQTSSHTDQPAVRMISLLPRGHNEIQGYSYTGHNYTQLGKRSRTGRLTKNEAAVAENEGP